MHSNMHISDEKLYWSFPEYKEPTRQHNVELDFMNFPDPSLYLIGFRYHYTSSVETTNKLLQTQ